MLVILLQKYWARFSRMLVQFSAKGLGPTLDRKSLNPVTVPPGYSSIDNLLRRTANEVAQQMPHKGTYAIWHSPEFAIRLSTKVKPDNVDEIRIGLGASAEAKNLTDVRNYIIHDNSRPFEDLQNRLGARGLSLNEFLSFEVAPDTTVYYSWLNDLRIAARNACN